MTLFRIMAASGAALLLAFGPACAQTVALKGADGRAVTLTGADLAALPRFKVHFDAHGDLHDYQGPQLIDVLAKVGAPSGAALHGSALAQVVLVTGADGYQVALGLAEADPGTRPNRIILADRADGAPLAAKDGPLKLVIEGDLRPARGVRQVVRIEVRSVVAQPGAAGR